MNTKKPVLYQCIAVLIGVTCNVLFNISKDFIPDMPLFMDTIFTIAVTFIAGLIPGLVTGLLSNVMFAFPWNQEELIFGEQLYALCSMATALIVYLYIRKRKTSLDFFDLLLLSLLTGFANSILGGIISTSCFRAMDPFPTDYIVAGMLLQDIPVLAAAIFARIPINLVDKTIAVLAGYGISLLAERKRGETRLQEW